MTASLLRNLLKVCLQRSSTCGHISVCKPHHLNQSSVSMAMHITELHRKPGFGAQREFHSGRTRCGHEIGTNGRVSCAKLDSRRLVQLTGPDATELLQGLVTNDAGVMWSEKRVMYTMFLNTQGRILFDVMCYRVSDDSSSEPCYLLECDVGVQEKLIRHLKMYRVRKKADISSSDAQFQTWAIFGDDNNGTNPGATPATQTTNCDRCPTDVTDPRAEGFGRRVILPKEESVTSLIPKSTEVSTEQYTLHRYRWGIPEGVIDLPLGESLPLESNLAFMNGVSFSKGCYLGQELTARTHYTGVTRKRIMPVQILSHGASRLENGAKIISEAGKNVGKFRSYLGNHGLALLRVAQSKDKKLLVIGEDGSRTELSAVVPTWWPSEEEQLMD